MIATVLRYSLTTVVVALVIATGLVQSAAAGSTSRGLATNTWAGTWTSTQGKTHLDASGNGTYDYCGGVITGSAKGDKLVGTWKQICGGDPQGMFEFTLSADGHSFDGRWRYATADGGRWREHNWQGTCVEGACLTNKAQAPAKPQGALVTVLVTARQVFEQSGDTVVTASGKFTAKSATCKMPCSLDLTPSGTMYGSYTQEDFNFRLRFRIESARLDLVSDIEKRLDIVGFVDQLSHPPGSTCETTGLKVSVYATLKPGRGWRMIFGCARQNLQFRKVTAKTVIRGQ